MVALVAAVALLLVGGGATVADRLLTDALGTEVVVTAPATPAPEVWSVRSTPVPAPGLSAHLVNLSFNPDLNRPTVVDGVLHHVGLDGRLRALDARTGSERWSVGEGDEFVTNVVLGDAHLVALVKLDDEAAGLTTNQLVTIDLRSGREVARSDVEANIYDESLNVVGDRVLYVAQDNVSFNEYLDVRRSGRPFRANLRLVAATLAGEELWTEPLAEVTDTDNPAKTAEVIVIGRNVVVSQGRLYEGHKLEAFRLSDGGRSWNEDVTPLVRQALAWGDHDLVLVSGNADVAVIDSRSGVVRERYSFADVTGHRAISRSFLAGDVLYAVMDEDHLNAVDLRTREVLWATETGRHREAFSGILEDTRLPGLQAGRIYLGGRDASVYAIDAATGTIDLRFEVPQLGSLVRRYPPIAFENLVILQDIRVSAYRPDPS